MPAVTDSTLVDQTTLESFFQLKTGITNEIWQDVLIEGAILIGICAAVWFVTRFTAKVIMKSVSNKTKSEFDDYLLNYNFFKWVANIIPALIIEVQERSVFGEILNDHSLVYKLTDALIAVLVTRAIIAFINATRDFLSKKPSLRDKPMASYSQLAKIFIYFISGIIIFSILSEKSPIYFLSAMGAMTAVMLLIFKDTILGFVASIQLSANDMIRIGDWISMPKFGADGDVLEINLTTIKVINFDKTITTIPTYSFISDSFKNWRGMEESDGRRIKRAINIKIGSVKFCDDALLERFSKVHLVSEYIDKKRKEIKEYNVDQQIDKSILANGRHLTNIGVFRVYLENYLRSNPYINTDMTSMVRQLHA
jgi:miniconductance mechanosensitive channel